MTDEPGEAQIGPVLDAHRFDEASLARYLKDRLPGCDDALTVHQFRGGQSNPTFLLDTGGLKFVLRKKPPGDLLPSAHAVDREFKVISALAGSGVPVPTPHLLCEDTSVIGQMFYVMSHVPGRIMMTRELEGCSREERREIYGNMIRVLADLHQVDYGAVGLSQFGRPEGYVARQVARWSKQYEASKIESCEAMDKLIAWLPNNAPVDDDASIVHGDYRPGNMVFEPASPKIAAVLDWELSTIGHPLADLGYFCMPYHLPSDVSSYGIKDLDLDGLGIPSEGTMLAAYCQQRDLRAVPDFDYYVVFSMFRLSAILAGVMRRGLDGNASDPTAVERGRTYRQMAECAWDIARGGQT